ncbi:hypothetical protein P7C70_g9590, partial [Phenoliferia sp. Uapishka_3]
MRWVGADQILCLLQASVPAKRGRPLGSTNQPGHLAGGARSKSGPVALEGSESSKRRTKDLPLVVTVNFGPNAPIAGGSGLLSAAPGTFSYPGYQPPATEHQQAAAALVSSEPVGLRGSSSQPIPTLPPVRLPTHLQPPPHNSHSNFAFQTPSSSSSPASSATHPSTPITSQTRSTQHPPAAPARAAPLPPSWRADSEPTLEQASSEEPAGDEGEGEEEKEGIDEGNFASAGFEGHSLRSVVVFLKFFRLVALPILVS